MGRMRLERKHKIILFVAVLAGTVAIAAGWSTINPGGPLPHSSPQFSVYTFTRSGNHTQFQISYSSGTTSGLTQVVSLSFDDKTGLGNYVQIKDEDCTSANVENSPGEFQVRVDCNTNGVFAFTRNGNHTQYRTTYGNGASSGEVQVTWLSFDNKTALGALVQHSPNCVSSITRSDELEFDTRISC